MSSFTGDVLLQIGGPSDLSPVESSPALHKIYASLDGVATDGVPAVEIDINAMPLRSKSVDTVVMIHSHEHSSSYQQSILNLLTLML